MKNITYQIEYRSNVFTSWERKLKEYETLDAARMGLEDLSSWYPHCDFRIVSIYQEEHIIECYYSEI